METQNATDPRTKKTSQTDVSQPSAPYAGYELEIDSPISAKLYSSELCTKAIESNHLSTSWNLPPDSDSLLSSLSMSPGLQDSDNLDLSEVDDDISKGTFAPGGIITVRNRSVAEELKVWFPGFDNSLGTKRKRSPSLRFGTPANWTELSSFDREWGPNHLLRDESQKRAGLGDASEAAHQERTKAAGRLDRLDLNDQSGKSESSLSWESGAIAFQSSVVTIALSKHGLLELKAKSAWESPPCRHLVTGNQVIKGKSCDYFFRLAKVLELSLAHLVFSPSSFARLLPSTLLTFFTHSVA
ncbi:MAG: hypothetical protein M1824_001567 [Vezdaea acicularis]|nr:MAG: hypothetical protein M1824_001567 [Vezdaea acicularis]